MNYVITDDSEMLDEAKVIMDGGKPKSENVTYSEIHTGFNYDDNKIKALIEQARSRKS